MSSGGDEIATLIAAMARLAAINPQITLVPHRQALDADSLAAAVSGVDLVLDCSDNFTTREADRKSVV